jgi:hypothetical protein
MGTVWYPSGLVAAFAVMCLVRFGAGHRGAHPTDQRLGPVEVAGRALLRELRRTYDPHGGHG